MLIIPAVRSRFYQHRYGAVLTSPSGDGALLAAVMTRFGLGNVRGSSSRRGSTAMRELTAVIEAGNDVAITPDGPRGPRYKLGPGIVFLAQKTGTPIVPINVEFGRCWRLGRWDGFMVPVPFTRAEVTFGELYFVKQTQTNADFEAERVRLEQTLMSMARHQ